MSIQGAPVEVAFDQSIKIHDGKEMLIYGWGEDAIWSKDPSDKLLRGLMIRLRQFETDLRVLRENWTVTESTMYNPLLSEIGRIDGWLDETDPNKLIETRLEAKFEGNKRNGLECEIRDGSFGAWPDHFTLPIDGDTMLKRWRLDRGEFDHRALVVQARQRLSIVLYFRMLGSTPPDKNGDTSAPKYVLTKIRAILMFWHEAYRWITEEDIEAIYQEVRNGRDKNFHKKDTPPTNPFDEWMPIMNHIRYGRADIVELEDDDDFCNYDYNLRPTVWDRRFYDE